MNQSRLNQLARGDDQPASMLRGCELTPGQRLIE
jgi:hypothetical protein